MNKHPRLLITLTATVALLAGCGGSDAEPAASGAPTTESDLTTTTPDTEPATTTPAATDPPPTDPPATDPADPELPDWASGEMVTVESDTGELVLPVELAAYCETSRSFYVAASALDHVEPEQPGAARELFGALAAIAPLAIDAAPAADFAAGPTLATEQLAVMIPAFESIDYDGSRIAELDDPQAMVDAVGAFGVTRDELLVFLAATCGADADVLDDQAVEAAIIAADAAGETVVPDEPVEAIPGTAVANTSGSIELAVPPEWTELEESVENGRDQLVVSADIDQFYNLLAPGVLVLRGEGGLRDGGYVGRVLDFQSDLEEIECVQVSEADYDDGLYIGQERIFDCGSEELEYRILGGTTPDETLYALVFLVSPIGQTGLRQLIIDTFQVS